jgi:hypothetical protein
MPKKDINETAYAVLLRATGEIAATPETVKAISGRKGGLKGGTARANGMTPEQRSAIAKKAAKARWTKP